MSIFRCEKCGCIENTATSNYWEQKHPFGGQGPKPLLCSECDPEIGKWHGLFPKDSAKGMMLADDGFLYTKEDVASDNFKFRVKHQGLKVVKEITESEADPCSTCSDKDVDDEEEPCSLCGPPDFQYHDSKCEDEGEDVDA